jgi:hypothetical protein
VWGVRLIILLATCLGVFILPFLLPARYFQGVSASNLAGFNNEVAAISAALLGTVVFFLALKWPQLVGRDRVEPPAAFEAQGDGRISRRLVGAVVLLWGGAVLLFGLTIIWMGVRYEYDWGYFLNRISVHAEFGRKLYSEMEFAYGPLLIDLAVMMRAILSPLHVSAVGAYLVTFVLEVMGGLLLLVYLIEHLPMSKRWRAAIFLLVAAGMMVTNMGPNYTFVRFAPQLAFLVLAWKCKRAWQAALWIFVGQAVCLGMSPEIGFAFLAGLCDLLLFHSRTIVGVGSRSSHCVGDDISPCRGLAVPAQGGNFGPRGLQLPCGAAAFHPGISVRPGVAGSVESCGLFPSAKGRGADVGHAVHHVAGAASGGLRKGRPGTCVLERPFGAVVVGGGYFVAALAAASRVGMLSRHRDSMDVQHQPLSGYELATDETGAAGGSCPFTRHPRR